MESRPPQEPPRRTPTAGRKPNGAGGSPTPPWIWVFLIAVVGLIAYRADEQERDLGQLQPVVHGAGRERQHRIPLTEGLVIHGQAPQADLVQPALARPADREGS